MLRLSASLCVVLCIDSGPRHTLPAQSRQRNQPKSRVTAVTWQRAPVCLNVSTGPDREIHSPFGSITVRKQNDELTLFIAGRPVTIGSDMQGRPIVLSDEALAVSAIPDCERPAYLLIDQQSPSDPTAGRQWLLDAQRTSAANEAAVVQFPSKHKIDTLLTLRGSDLTVSYDAAEGDEKIFRYHPEPVRAFVRQDAKSKYIPMIGKPTADFFRNGQASESVFHSAGQEVFDLLRERTPVGTTRIFQGRYLIVEGSAEGDFQRHAAVVVDTVKDVPFFVLCDDRVVETGALVGASPVEGADDEVLAAFRFAGFVLFIDQGKFACDGECHDERLLLFTPR